MTIEESIFQKVNWIEEKLLAFGFSKVKDEYFYHRDMMDHAFRVDIVIDSNKKISGKIWDKELDEEYTNFRIENVTGEFINRVKYEFQEILLQIKEQCTEKKYFISNQANRITSWIERNYHDLPQFLWPKYDDIGVFKHIDNDKWYGIIMCVKKDRLDKKSEEMVEIINVKINPKDLDSFLQIKGVYPAYHMNKKYWISLILDDSLEDSKIESWIENSFLLTK